MLRRPTEWARSFACLVVVLVLVAVNDEANGQGTQVALPDPITTAQLTGYAERLGLSLQQRQAFELLHDEYKRQFRVLRDGDIADFMKYRSSFDPGALPDRKVIEDLFDRVEMLLGKIRRLDESFFDGMAPLLTEPQAALLPGVRLARERTRHESQQMNWATGRRPVDLSKFYYELELDPETKASADPTITAYERKLTVAMRKTASGSVRMYLDMFDRMEELGFADIDLTDASADPEQMAKFMEAMQLIWKELTAKSVELNQAMDDLNARTFKGLTAILPEESADELRNSYYAKAYPEVAYLLKMLEEPWLDTALEIDDLPPDEKNAIIVAIDDFRREGSRAIEDAVALIDEHRRTFSPFDMGSDSWQDYQTTLEELRRKVTSGQKQMHESLMTLLGPDRFTKLQAKPASDAALADKDSTSAAAAAAAVATAVVEEGVEGGAESFDPAVPRRMSQRELGGYLEQLELREDERVVVDELYASYVESMRELPEAQTLRTARQSLWKYDHETGQATPSGDEEIAALSDHRRRVATAMAALEDAFFTDVEAVIAEDKTAAIERVRRQRQRARYEIKPSRGAALNTFSPRDVDLVALVAASELPEESDARLTETLDRYAAESLTLLGERYEAVLTMEQTIEQWNAELMRMQRDGKSVVDWGRRYQDLITPIQERMSGFSQRLRAMNRTYMALLEAELPAEEASALGRRLDAKTYPQVFSDPASVNEQLARAMGLPDLTAAQRESLDELAATYRPEYGRLSREMVSIVNQGSMHTLSLDRPEEWQGYQDRVSAIQRFSYDRDELSARAANRIESILRAEQLAMVGPLPDPGAGETRRSW